MTLRRRWEEKFFHVVSGVVTLLIIFVLVHLIWSIVEKGASYLSWDIISKPPKGTFYFGGEGGGFLNAIAGSFYLAMGSTRTETAYKIFFRQALPGLATAILLAFGRGIGDAASVLFTAGYTDNIPSKLSDPTATLPLTIYYQLQSPSEDMQNLAYTAAIILTFIVLCTSIT